MSGAINATVYTYFCCSFYCPCNINMHVYIFILKRKTGEHVKFAFNGMLTETEIVIGPVEKNPVHVFLLAKSCIKRNI